MSFGNDAVERSVRRLGGFGRAGRTYLAFEALDEGLPGFASLTASRRIYHQNKIFCQKAELMDVRDVIGRFMNDLNKLKDEK